MNLPAAILFGAVEGLTEFLPVSSTGHLTIIERLLGYQLDAADVTAFTAIIQTGAVLATLIYLRDEFRRIVFAIIRGMFRSGWRADPDWRFGWAVVLGSIPIGIVGLLFQDAIETTLRSLWFVAAALILWSLPMLYADRTATQKLGESEITWRDTLIIGLAQCLALVPGVSRSGATMTAGLLRGFDRVAVTRLSFMLSVPALTAAGILQAYTAADDISTGVGWPATIVATVVSFVVAYFSVAWLLRFVARHTFMVFIVYRIGLGLLLLVLLGLRAGLGDLTVAAGGDVQVDLAHLRELRAADRRRSRRWSPPPRPRRARRPCPAGPRPAAPPGRAAWSARRRTRSTSGWSASSRRMPSRTGAGAASPMSISLVSRPSR